MMLGTVQSGFGYWNVYAWIIFFALAAVLVFYFRSAGRSDYKMGTYQDEIFYGGNPVPKDGDEIAVPASSAYWGFTEALSPFYKLLLSLHTGIASDYMGYLVVTTALISALIVL